MTMTISVLQNFVFPAASAFLLSRMLDVTGVWFGFLMGESLTLIGIVLAVFIKNKKCEFSAVAFSLLSDEFGIRDEDCFEATIEEQKDVVEVSKKAYDFCLEHGLGPKTSHIIALSAEEMANNVVVYGFRGRRDHNIDVRVMIRDGSPVLRIRDNCERFDPVHFLELHKADGPEEHIGIRMIMKLVKDANYVNSLGLNNLTLTM